MSDHVTTTIPPHLYGPGDAMATISIVAAVFQQLPTILGIVAATLGILWYAVLFYDRFVTKKPADIKSTPDSPSKGI